ncbi:MAG: transglutaminase-like cysteine peptidase [Ignavibacteriales bacterium]
MTQVNRTLAKYFASALGAALLAASPAAAQTIAGADLLALAKSSAILGGQPSALAMIEARQSGRTLPVVLAPAPSPAAFQVGGYMQPAVFSRPARAEPMGSTPDLFGSKAIKVANTRLDAQWRRVSHSDGAASGLIRASYTDRAQQLQTVNRWVNHAIAYADDSRVYGRPDYWANASESLRRGKGDCEDFAIAKMQILRAMGVPQRDLYLVIVRDLVRHADHAVLAVRTNAGFVILDSNTDKVLPQGQVSDYRPILTFNSEGSWIHGFSAERPQMTLASTAPLTPGAR